MCILEAEVVTHRDKKMVLRQVIALLRLNPVVKLLSPLRCIICVKILIDYKRLIFAERVKIEATWCAVVMV
jgi:hypothetical protein